MITKYYILMGVIAVFGWLFILNWKEGIDPCKLSDEENLQKQKDFKDKLIEEMRDDF